LSLNDKLEKLIIYLNISLSSS